METIWDCAIIGGGPAGLSAALVLGRARRNVVLFDSGRPRNAVTRETHGFLTRDGIPPYEFRRISHEELARYPSVRIRNTAVADARNAGGHFQLRAMDGLIYRSRKILLATGLVEELPAVPGIRDFYGVSLFNCPYCDGWERKDEPLVIISETEHAFDLVKSVYPWSRNLILATNGHYVLSHEQRRKLAARGIPVYEQRIRALVGTGGRLEKVVFENGAEERRAGGFVSPVWSHPNVFDRALGCRRNEHGGIAADDFGRTSAHGVFAAGDAANIVPPQLIVAAAGGCRAAIGINSELTSEDF
ncbi:NAD(P)/FAD-dependent oxidoreductase [Cohnella caldifontis]|uniref:NAD(P)/FAD-dependent oxidoreductase n=1 Tax=Cohnella caldifontis TaxID=3027471 RepID=UPI0023EE1A1E|nr:NAD(P)/FAD-dependent oxidoreductase [Cohnella sp. YIM B05605]